MAIEYIRLDARSDEWFKERQNRIGSSDVGTVLGLTAEYKHPVETYYEKINPIIETRGDNAPMFWGRELEDKVAEIWQYWDGTESGYITNRNEGKVIRKARRMNAIVVNSDYPWLAVNNDRVAIKGQVSMADGGLILDHPFPVECKTIHTAEASKWEVGVPPYHLAQVTTQMIVMGVGYGEIAVFDNYRTFKVIPVKLDEEYADYLINITKEFWYKRVVPAKEIIKQVGWLDFGNLDPRVQELEPPTDGSKALEQFWSKKMKGRLTEEVLKGDEAFHFHADKMKYWQAVEKGAKTHANFHKNSMIEVMKREKVSKVDLGSSGYCSWSERKGSEKLTFNNYSKYEHDVEELGHKLTHLKNIEA
jgi:putative phage-type endonuclease